MIKRVLVPMDSSPSALRAANLGIEMAKRFGAKLILLSVINVPEYGALKGEVDPQIENEGINFYRSIQDQAEEQANAQNIPLERRIVSGHPADTIVAMAEQESVDLIVLGRKGSSTIRRFFQGSVAQKVTVHAPCNVLLVD